MKISSLSTALVAGVAISLATMTVAADATTTVVCLGDSITEGVSTDEASQPYPDCLQELLGLEYLVKNSGVASATTVRLLQSFPALVKIKKANILVIMAGVNDINIWDGETGSIYGPAQTISRLTEIGYKATELEARVIYLTIWPDDDFTPAKLEAIRQINTWIVNEAGTVVGGAKGNDSAELLTGKAGATAAGLKSDLHDGSNLHLNTNGHRALAEAVAKALLPDNQ